MKVYVSSEYGYAIGVFASLAKAKLMAEGRAFGKLDWVRETTTWVAIRRDTQESTPLEIQEFELK